MAFSKSVKKGQIPINCELCEGKISSKCLDCDLLLCNGCKENIHSKFKNAGDHRVKDIKGVGKHSNEELDFRDIKCKEHSGQYGCLFCRTCDHVVCPTCITKVHKTHDLVEIREVYEDKINTIKTKFSHFQKEEAKIQEQKNGLMTLKTAEIEKYNKIDQEILDHGKALKQAVDHYIEKTRTELQEKQNAYLQSINSDLDTIEKTSQQCDLHTIKTDDLINTTDTTKFFEEVGEVEKLADKSFVPQIQSTYHPTPIFIPGEITQSNVVVLNTDNKLLDNEINVINEFQTEVPVVHYVCPCPDDSLWIGHTDSSKLQMVKPQGTSLQILSSHKITVFDMALTPNNDLLLATKTHIKQITNNTGTTQDSIYNIDPYKPSSVFVSKDYKVMVGGIRQGRGAVIVMNQTGEQLIVYQQDKQNQPLFTYPKRITSTSNNNVFVADYRNSDGHGRLVIIDKSGDVQYYTGHPEVNKTEAFKPIGLTTTPNDNVIVIDYYTYTLHIFNNSGQLITFYRTLDKGIPPYSLGYSPAGHLYIGGSRPQGSKDNSKLYHLNITGC